MQSALVFPTINYDFDREPTGATATPKAVTQDYTELLAALRDRLPRIADRIQAVWGYPECDQYLNRLIIDDRGNRQGFPADVLTLLLRLSVMHASQFSILAEQRYAGDRWLINNHS